MQMAKRPAPTGRDPETRSRAEPWRLRKSRMTTADRQVAVPTTARERAPRRRPGGVSGDAVLAGRHGPPPTPRGRPAPPGAGRRSSAGPRGRQEPRPRRPPNVQVALAARRMASTDRRGDRDPARGHAGRGTGSRPPALDSRVAPEHLPTGATAGMSWGDRAPPAPSGTSPAEDSVRRVRDGRVPRSALATPDDLTPFELVPSIPPAGPAGAATGPRDGAGVVRRRPRDRR
jgi:hypothetical protein